MFLYRELTYIKHRLYLNYLIGLFAAKKRKKEYVQNFHVINVPIVPMNVDQTRIVPETKNVVTMDVLIHV